MKKCGFCDNQLNEYRGVYFCDQCKKVAYISSVEPFQFKQIILDYIVEKRRILNEHQGELHDLLQDKLKGKHLSEEEINVIDLCYTFNGLSSELEYLLNNTPVPKSSMRIRELLYEMLLLDKMKIGE